MYNGDLPKRVRTAIDELIVDVLFNNVVSKDFRVSKDLAGSLKAGSPETVLLLEAEKSGTVVGVELRKAERRVQGKDAHSPSVESTNGIFPRFFVRNLDKRVASDSTGLRHFQKNALLVVVYFPDTVEKVRNDCFSGFGAAEAHAFPESKASKVVEHCAVVVNRNLHLALLTSVSPVVTQVHRPVERIAV